MMSIQEAYDKVFDENGERKLGGREACMDLVEKMENLQREIEGVDFGNVETGFMKSENIKRVVAKLREEVLGEV